MQNTPSGVTGEALPVTFSTDPERDRRLEMEARLEAASAALDEERRSDMLESIKGFLDLCTPDELAAVVSHTCKVGRGI